MEPEIAVQQRSAKPAAVAGTWTAAWEIRNVGAEPLTIVAARFPHGKFLSEEIPLEPAINLAAQEARTVELEVRCNQPAGMEVENAFLILRVLQHDDPWLVLARLRVRVSKDGAPAATTELITVQRVGFSSQR